MNKRQRVTGFSDVQSITFITLYYSTHFSTPHRCTPLQLPSSIKMVTTFQISFLQYSTKTAHSKNRSEHSTFKTSTGKPRTIHSLVMFPTNTLSITLGHFRDCLLFILQYFPPVSKLEILPGRKGRSTLSVPSLSLTQLVKQRAAKYRRTSQNTNSPRREQKANERTGEPEKVN